MIRLPMLNRIPFLFLLLIVAISYLFYSIDYNSSSTNTADMEEETSSVKICDLIKLTHWNVMSYVQQFKEQSFILRGLKSYSCKILPLNYSICLYDKASDSYVSENIRKNNIWEAEVTQSISDALKRYPDAQFIDMGGFVGWHSLHVAATTSRSVIVVDPFMDNIFLMGQSAIINTFESISLLPYCIYSQKRKFNATVHISNPGETPVAQKVEREVYYDRKLYSNNSVQLNCVTLDDLANCIDFKQAILKIDIEGSEVDVFMSDSSSTLFDIVDIPVVFMEWSYIKSISFYAQMSTMDYFVRRGYLPYGGKFSNSTPLSRDDTNKWPMDIMWMKG